MQEMNVKELADRIKAGNAPLIIDVREPNEYAYARIPGAVLKPLGDFREWALELDKDREYVLQCHTGSRRLAGRLSAGADGLYAGLQSQRRHRGVVDARRSERAEILKREK